MSKVSVVVPIYNPGNKLRKCISSILNQSFNDFELILVNDGSTDDSLNVCMKYQKEDNRVIVINKLNEGSVKSRNRGIARSKSDYIMFVDADDWIDKNYIELLYNESIRNSVDVTVCNIYKVIGSGIIKKRNVSSYFNDDRIYRDEEVKNEIVTSYLHGHSFPSSLCAKMYKREVLVNSGKYLERIHYLGDDLFYNMEIFLNANSVKMLNKPLYYYRVGGFTSKYMPFLFDDMVNGYEIQKEVIEQFFSDNRERQYYGISLMLLNTFKTCLKNLFFSELNQIEIKKNIEIYLSNRYVIECLDNEGSKKYFSNDYLNAIRFKDVEYLFQLGQSLYKRSLPRRYLTNFLSLV
ncbi:glycosyltransferase [Paenibacillus sp. LMG 31461]|uniref:Glycosyltransferase n=1 Tax=Paenibacillus plantarum TaxID=2654975 RepID=A0ABX1X9R1_9BACL|nr:glycosyltransferase family 2 protein [Paenibacillus plantarum]NOU65187.1 glycosyltransferase [Paenibacillus plantarum]